MAGPPLKPVAITFVSSHAQMGGSERHLELLLESLGPDWVRGVVSLQEGPFVDRLRALGLPVEVVPTPARAGMLAASLKLRKVLRRHSPDLVHANGVKAALAVGLATPGMGVPIVWAKHDYSWDGPLARLLALRCTRVVAVSEAITTSFGPRTRGRVVVVPNGVPEYERERSAGRELVAELLASPADAPVTLLVGRIHPAKGQLELIGAAPEVLRRSPQARFLLLGGEDPSQPEYARLVRQRIDELGLGERVTLAGHRPDALRVMSGCDVVVLPSVADERGAGKEACPFSLLEAMSVGTPVVAYAVGGIPEVLGDCGSLVPEGDTNGLAEAVLALLESEDARSKASACALARVRERHQLEVNVRSMEQVYREALRPEERPRARTRMPPR
jgi:glycosyltransferase involved in cell wall biosynthesis